ALLYYDYVLTSGREVELVWKAKFSPSTVLYVLCRYALLANLLYLLAFRDQIGLRVILAISCDKWYKIIAVLGVLGRAAVIVTFTLRTYVVWAQSRLVLLSLVMIGLSTVMTDAVRSKVANHLDLNNESGFLAILDLARSFLTIVFETLSAILIFIRCLQAFRRGESSSGQRNFTYLLGEQGISNFSIVSLFTIATFVLKLTKFLHDLLNAFTLPVSGLLTARFLLNLREWNIKQSATLSYPAAVDEEGKSHRSTSTQSVSITGLTSSTWMSTAEFGEDPIVTMIE
ncbi:hypothetical protein BDP27DRAFT_1207946, partial [Rhodocollybia butyracea]